MKRAVLHRFHDFYQEITRFTGFIELRSLGPILADTMKSPLFHCFFTFPGRSKIQHQK